MVTIYSKHPLAAASLPTSSAFPYRKKIYPYRDFATAFMVQPVSFDQIPAGFFTGWQFHTQHAGGGIAWPLFRSCPPLDVFECGVVRRDRGRVRHYGNDLFVKSSCGKRNIPGRFSSRTASSP